jgi:hypothetical protein
MSSFLDGDEFLHAKHNNTFKGLALEQTFKVLPPSAGL